MAISNLFFLATIIAKYACRTEHRLCDDNPHPARQWLSRWTEDRHRIRRVKRQNRDREGEPLLRDSEQLVMKSSVTARNGRIDSIRVIYWQRERHMHRVRERQTEPVPLLGDILRTDWTAQVTLRQRIERNYVSLLVHVTS